MRITSMTPNIIGTLPIGFFELFAKAGMMWYDVDYRERSGLLG